MNFCHLHTSSYTWLTLISFILNRTFIYSELKFDTKINMSNNKRYLKAGRSTCHFSKVYWLCSFSKMYFAHGTLVDLINQIKIKEIIIQASLGFQGCRRIIKLGIDYTLRKVLALYVRVMKSGIRVYWKLQASCSATPVL